MRIWVDDDEKVKENEKTNSLKTYEVEALLRGRSGGAVCAWAARQAHRLVDCQVVVRPVQPATLVLESPKH